jgi:hypothetical protein
MPETGMFEVQRHNFDGCKSLVEVRVLKQFRAKNTCACPQSPLAFGFANSAHSLNILS